MITCEIIQADCLSVLEEMRTYSVDLIYIDPPFNTGKTQKRNNREMSYEDSFGEEFKDFLYPRIWEAYNVLKSNGSIFVHLDYRETHNIKLNVMDAIMGKDCFRNEIIWAFDYGARSKSRWSVKHNNILWYTHDRKDYTFNYDAIDRIPYMAPGLVGKEKAEKGKTPTDVWWQTIVPTNGKEKTGYPTQKPLPILERIVKVHSNPGDTVLDFFAGSGTTGEAALKNGRNAILIDENPEAIEVMEKRLSRFNPKVTRI